ncbi:hypothetical protein U771_15970 [Pseudomonas gorinensis]|uniref:Uncharacterized protein n=1 Tax=Pseudomonas gorinensis TaxID=3240790 RepID=A0ACA7P6W9_9PSED|nr:hypothetical protein U771_15970 [Pseudomonas sp. TKP]
MNVTVALHVAVLTDLEQISRIIIRTPRTMRPGLVEPQRLKIAACEMGG